MSYNDKSGEGDRQGTGQYLVALGLPVLFTFVLVAIVVATHLG